MFLHVCLQAPVDLTPLGYKLATYVSSSDLCAAHIRAAWPITAADQTLDKGLFEVQTAHTVSIVGI